MTNSPFFLHVPACTRFCTRLRACRAGGGEGEGEGIGIPPSDLEVGTPNSEVVLKIFKVEFEVGLGKCNLMKRVENIRRERSNKRVEFKK